MWFYLVGALITGASPWVYDAASDFTIQINPALTGIWSYGWRENAVTGLHLYSTHFDKPFWGQRVIGWSMGGEQPQVALNVSGHTVEGPGIRIPKGRLCLYPGRGCEYSVVRWTCPASGHYRLSAQFEAFARATTDVHIVKNGGILGEEEIGNHGFAHDFSFESLDLKAGDSIDFVVGCGANRNYYGDVTGLSATFRRIP